MLALLRRVLCDGMACLGGRSWNPDLPQDREALEAGDEVLISSATMYGHREAPWSVRNGTFVADSQVFRASLSLVACVSWLSLLPVSLASVSLKCFTSLTFVVACVCGAVCWGMQAVCLLPNICTHAPLEEGEKAFSCSSCEPGSAFCTGALCIRGEVCVARRVVL